MSPKEPLEIGGGIVIPASEISYSYSRSGGSGGQHVNTTDTRVQLRFEMASSSAIRQDVKNRIRKGRPSLLTRDGALIFSCDKHRSRHQNVQDAQKRLANIILEYLVPPKPRRATRPTRASKQRRLDNKQKRGDIKRQRGKVRSSGSD